MHLSHDFAILFDMDGVIVDSNPAHKIALKQFCTKHGFDLSEEYLLQHIYGRTNRQWLTQVFGELPPATLAAYAEEKEALYRTLYAADIRPVSGLVEFLESLDHHGIARAIGTSAPPANVSFTLEHTGIKRFFNTIIDETQVSRGKPDPEIYLKAAAALNQLPERCVVIEDSLSGIEAGKAAGARVIAITTTHTPAEVQHADMIISDFTELSVDGIRSLIKQ